jgi:hypothetical protein
MALALARPVPLGLHRSHNLLWSTVSEHLQQIVFSQLIHETSLDATNVYYRYTQRLGGLSRVAFQVSQITGHVSSRGLVGFDTALKMGAAWTSGTLVSYHNTIGVTTLKTSTSNMTAVTASKLATGWVVCVS